MLHKVEPPEKGIPHFKDIHVSNVVVKHARKAINGSGLEQSLLENFHFSDVDINADNAGEVSYARGWEWKRVTIRSKDSSTVRINNSNGLIL
jgi:hypothetical protein